MKKKTGIIILIIILAAAAVFLLWKFVFSKKGEETASEETVFVTTVAELSGQGGAVGAVNRFGGVAEPVETWSVNQNPDTTVKEIYVSVGDEVMAGDPLFIYDTEKYKSEQEQAEIDLERLNNEKDTIIQTIEQLYADQKKAKASEQADYTVRIKESELQQKQKELEIKSKEISIQKLIENQENAVVTSEIDGVIKSINNGTSASSGSTDEGFITVMKTDQLQIKGTINEQNISQIMVGAPLLVHSRTDESQIWKGTINKINTENAVSGQSSLFGSSDNDSSSYYFYVTLEDSTGMMLGQHVYMESDLGQADVADDGTIRIPSYYITSDKSGTFVWADDGSGKLTKKDVTVGLEDEESMMAEIADGLTTEDALAFPDESLKEGMPTAAAG